MEITIDRNTVYGILVFLALLSFLGLGTLGKPYTPVTTTGETRLLTWDDWQVLKAERQYTSERTVLRSDADALASLLNQAPDPVAAQLLEERISRHTSNGQAALLTARTALLQAAKDAASWTSGGLDRDTAVASFQTATDLLK
jgi:hypothetical protein